MDDVHILEQGQVLDAHDLCDDGQAGLFLGLGEQLQALSLHALEGVGRGAGLEGAAPEELGPGLFHFFSHVADLLLTFHRAGPSNQGQMPVADFLPSRQSDDGVVRMEFPVGFFIGLLHPLDALHKILCFDILRVDGGGVANQSQHRALGTHPGIHLHIIVAGEFLDEVVHDLLLLMGFEYDDHCVSFLSQK